MFSEELKFLITSEKSVKICRVCLIMDNSNTDFSHEISQSFDEDCLKLCLEEIFYKCTQIKIEMVDSTAPRSLCKSCIDKLKVAHAFKLQCEKSDEIIKRLLLYKQNEALNSLQRSANDEQQPKDEEVGLEEIKDTSLSLDDCEDYLEDLASKSRKKAKVKKKRDADTLEEVVKPAAKKQYPPLYDEPDQEQSCSVCSHSCPNVRELIKHRSHHHGKNKFQCLVCGNGFTTTRGLRIHYRQHSGEKPETCTICGKSFADPRTLRNHVRIHSGEQRFPCEICNKRYASRSALENHMMSHSDKKPHQCTVCNRSYRQAVSLKVHMRVHSGYRPHKCNICTKSFTNSTSLRVHMVTHNGEKNYQCPTCGHCMAHSSELVIHMRSHSGEKPYKCQHCERAFTNIGALKAHLPTHTGEKNFACFVCGKRVARSSELRVHMRTHSGEKRYACKHCGKKFSTRSNMLVHQRKHTGEKPHCCEVCGRRFSDLHVLKNHRLTHSGELPHTCPQPGCQSKFRQHSTLKAHLSTHIDDSKVDEHFHKTKSKETKTGRRTRQRIAPTLPENSLNSDIQNVQIRNNANNLNGFTTTNDCYQETQIYLHNSFIS